MCLSELENTRKFPRTTISAGYTTLLRNTKDMVLDMLRMEKFSKIILTNFFLIVLLSRLCEIAGLFNMLRLFQLSGLMLGVYFARTIKVKGFDILIFFYLVYIILNSLLTDYTYHLQFLY